MRAPERRSLADLRRRLINQLDQKTGPEKRILRRTILEIEARLRARRGAAGNGHPPPAPR